jgi:Zn finger protein HypA/HybF involved in hydrogenase expression
MSEFGEQARGSWVDILCVQCEEVFAMDALIFLDGGLSECPHCGRFYHLDNANGVAVDRMIARFRERLQRSSGGSSEWP